MRKFAHVDFETFSELSIKAGKKNSVGAVKYSRHPSTEILCMAWAIGDEDPELWLPGDPPPTRLMKHVREGGLVCAWNAEFEIPVWENIAAERLGWLPVPLKQWRDTAALALTFSLPAALEDAGGALGVDVVKDPRGKHLINKLCKPRNPSKNDPSTRWTYDKVPQDYEDFYEYCRQDVRSERAIHEALPRDDLTPSELETWMMTVVMNLRGWFVDLDTTRRVIELMDKYKVKALAELRALTGYRVHTAGQRDKLLAWLSDQGVHMPDMKAETVEETLLRKDLTRRARRALEIRQVLSGAAVNKFGTQVRLADADSVVRNLLMYHGAGTGRDAGRGIQIQNYLRASVSKTEAGVNTAIAVVHSEDPIPTIEQLYGPVPKFAALLTRSMLTSRPDHDLYSGDYSSIENRLSAWYAGAEHALGVFRKGLDEYGIFAAKYYSCDYDELIAAYKAGDADADKKRTHGKRAVLSLMFGSGWKKFQATCEQYGDPCTDEVAQDTVDFYRRELYPEVPDMWYDLEDAAKAAIQHPGTVTRVKRKYATAKFHVAKDFLFMTLASGRRIAYHKPKIQMKRTPWGQMRETITHMGREGKTGRWVRQKLIPGTIFNNLVQGTARDYMMAGCKRAVRAGYPLIGRVHDELINERERGAGGSVEEYTELICPDLDWLQGVPMLAECWTGTRYKKA